MKKEELGKYLEAVDLVCINCEYAGGSYDRCDYCPVREMRDIHVADFEQEEQSGE